ncbi:MAG: NAD(P)H-binding protein [Pseudomonadales bacterium]
MSHDILIIGFGDIGAAVARTLAQRGHAVTVLVRHLRPLEPTITQLLCDVSDAKTVADALHARFFSYALICLSPSEFTKAAYAAVFDSGIKNLLRHFPASLKKVFFVSSTSVYGQRDGEWVNENSVLAPTQFNGEILLTAEQLLRDSDFSEVIVRFAGIYGRGQQILLSKVRNGELASAPSPFTNRIHRDDCIAVLLHLFDIAFAEQELHSSYLAADNEPVRMRDLQLWLRAAITANGGSLDSPLNIPATNTPRNQSSNKRCDNSRLLASGYRFRYPTFRDGYADIL